ncbi:MAG: RNA polymerase sigma factor [Solirubrobacterales bacterium]
MNPLPPSEATMASRLLAGPALRVQPDSRLVTLARDGYESAFEEIVRRYGKPLRRYATAIVTAQRAEDVTQDAFSKAFVALKGSDKEIQLRPWLYRVLRNTALNALRDAPPASAELDESRAEGPGEPLDTLERREQIQRLVDGLRDLPEHQRAAIVMRELEGLSHAQIAASLGLSGGAVRQSIYRARQTLRDAVGLLVPLPFVRILLEGGGDAAVAGSAAAAGGAAAVGGLGAAGAGGGAGVGVGVKAGLAALLAASTVTTGVALNDQGNATPGAKPGGAPTAVGALPVNVDQQRGDGLLENNRGPGKGSNDSRGGSESSGPGSSHGGSPHSESGSSGSGSGADHSGPDHSGSGSSGSGSSGSDSGSSGSESNGSGSGSSGSGSGDADPLDLPD